MSAHGERDARTTDPPPRAVVFDLDGTLIDSFAGIAASVNHTLRALGRAEVSEDDVRGRVGWGLEKLLEGLFAREDRDRARDAYRAHYDATCVRGTTVLPGAREALARLHARGVRLGVATNKPLAFSRKLLAGLGLAPYLDAVVAADDVEHPKPHPQMLERALERLGVAPGDALYVGDMHVDLETARRAGVRFVAVATGAATAEELLRAGAGRVIGSLTELVI